MNFGLVKKLGYLFKNVIGTVPVEAAAGTRNGTGIDRAAPGGQLFAFSARIRRAWL